jgi:hypothetical protein
VLPWKSALNNSNAEALTLAHGKLEPLDDKDSSSAKDRLAKNT